MLYKCNKYKMALENTKTGKKRQNKVKWEKRPTVNIKLKITQTETIGNHSQKSKNQKQNVRNCPH